jgi:DNA-binding transcriptional ArsR family regulator
LTSRHRFDISRAVEISLAVGSLWALAQETRLRIFRALVARGPEGMPAGRIAQRLELPGPTLSFHLAQLKQAGLVVCRREGRSLIYSADFEAMRDLVDYLTENCCREAPARCLPGARSARSRSRRA